MKQVKFEQYLDKKDIVNLAQASRTIHRDFQVLASQYVLVLLKDENARMAANFTKALDMMENHRDEVEYQRDVAVKTLARMMRVEGKTRISVFEFEMAEVFNELQMDSHHVEHNADDGRGFYNLQLELDERSEDDEDVEE